MVGKIVELDFDIEIDGERQISPGREFRKMVDLGMRELFIRNNENEKAILEMKKGMSQLTEMVLKNG